MLEPTVDWRSLDRQEHVLVTGEQCRKSLHQFLMGVVTVIPYLELWKLFL